ncbi:MAG: hypothetical protein K2X45_10525 [Phreatobacter sp.]|nr:hypothetical protein [Phreatobacter sp.]
MKRILPLPSTQLLRLAEAAAFCSLTISVFERTCPVAPINLSPDGRDDRRLLRYDVRALHEWIDLLSGRVAGMPEYWNSLAELDP